MIARRMAERERRLREAAQRRLRSNLRDEWWRTSNPDAAEQAFAALVRECAERVADGRFRFTAGQLTRDFGDG